MSLKPIIFENQYIIVHPFRPVDSHEQVTKDLFDILTNEEVTKYIPEKKIKDYKEAGDRLYGIVLGYHIQMKFTHFITFKESNKVIGCIDILTPAYTKANYRMNHYPWMIEYYLHNDFWGNGIMTGVLFEICMEMKKQGISKIGAACNTKNSNSISILNRIGFKLISKFDFKQDYYELLL